MLYPDRGAQWIDEDMPIDHYPVAEGNIAAESGAARFTASGGIGLVLRFGWFYGPGAAHSEEMLGQARHHIGMILGPPGSYVSSIHLSDAATAVVRRAGPHRPGPSMSSMTSPSPSGPSPMLWRPPPAPPCGSGALAGAPCCSVIG